MVNHKKFRISTGVTHLIFILLSLCCIVPLLIALSISFTEEQVLVTEGYQLIPKSFTLDAYRYVFTGASSVLQAYKVTIFYTAVTTILHLLPKNRVSWTLGMQLRLSNISTFSAMKMMNGFTSKTNHAIF